MYIIIMKFDINLNILKAMRKNNRQCLCAINTPCPCDKFIDEQACRCNLFKKVD